ncbi:MAG: PaaI family thioesterase [Planctomycetaceae bacterium]|nr:PaaI family thioesterase [Planctomycetaceae bacterium]
MLHRQVPLLDTLGIEPIEAHKGVARLRMTVDERHLRTLGMLHGGVTATLLDTALGYAVTSLAAEGFHAVTAQLNVNFTRPVSRGEVLEATGLVLHSGSQTAVASGEVRNADGKLIATATGTFLYLRLS